MNYEEIFNNSFSVVAENTTFYHEFYSIFMAKAEDIRDIFRDVDMPSQQRMLKMSLMYMVNFSATKSGTERFQKLALIHSGLNIKNQYYDLWLDSLVEAAKRVFPSFTNQDALAWRIMLSPGIEFMKSYSRYQSQ